LRIIRPAGAFLEPKWLKDYERALRADGLAPNSVRSYRHAARRFLAWLHDNKQPFEKIGPEDLIGYKHQMLKVDKLKGSSVNPHLLALRRLCRWAVGRGLLKEDPSTPVKTRRVPRTQRPSGLAAGPAHRVVRAAGQSSPSLRQRDVALVQVLLQAGLRINEAVSLEVGDVTLRDRSGHLHIREGKGDSERSVPLNASARRAIRGYLESRRRPKSREPLFLSREGRFLSVRAAQSLICELGRRAKLERISPHTLRHTFAVNYLRDNPGKLSELAALLGHQSLDTTAIYTQPSAEELAADLEGSRLNVDDS
jgi:site-specific recombinase XerD